MEACPKCKLYFSLGIIRRWGYFGAVTTCCPICALAIINSYGSGRNVTKFNDPKANELLRRAREQFKEAA